MRNKILILVACVLVVALSLSSFAFAASSVDSDDNYDYCWNYAIVKRISDTGSFNWNGSPEFNLTYPTFGSHTSVLNYTILDGYNDLYSVFFNKDDVNAFGINFTACYRFTNYDVTKNYVTFTVPDGVTYNFFVLLYQDISKFDALTDNPYDLTFSDYYVLNGKTLGTVNDGWQCAYYPLELYRTRYGTYTASASYSGLDFPRFKLSFTLNSSFYDDRVHTYGVYSYSLPAGTYTFRATSKLYTYNYVLGMFNYYTQPVGLSEGYDKGYTEGYDKGYTAGYDDGYINGVATGKDQAYTTVNTGSASYNAGYTAGIASANDYTFMSLIASVIDAPIRAFFGYTENGVKHPGLFSLDILGFDMSALILSLFSLCVIVLIVKLCLGGK